MSIKIELVRDEHGNYTSKLIHGDPEEAARLLALWDCGVKDDIQEALNEAAKKIGRGKN